MALEAAGALVYGRDPPWGNFASLKCGIVAIRKFQIALWASRCLWPFVSVRARVFGSSSVSLPVLACVCLSTQAGVTSRW